MTELRFNWHEHARRQGHQGDFLSYVFVHALAEQRGQTPDLVERISEASDGFQDVRMTFVINGITVDGQSFVNGLERILDSSVERAAVELLETRISEFPEIHDAIEAARRFLLDRLAAAGVRIPED